MGARYLNTDLEVWSTQDLQLLAQALEERGFFVLETANKRDGLWRCRFESDKDHPSPPEAILDILRVVWSLPQELRQDWLGCSSRVFDVGIESSVDTFSSTFELGDDVIGLLAKEGATLRMTLYRSSP